MTVGNRIFRLPPFSVVRILQNRGWAPFVALAGAVFLLYGGTLSFGFVWLDDYVLIVERLKELGEWRNWYRPFFEHYFRPSSYVGLYYRPLVTLSYMVDAWIGGGRVWPFHLTNLFLHILASWGVFLFLEEGIKRMGEERWAAFWGALVFAVHPANVMAVAWVPGRNDLLLAVFALISILGFLRYERTGDGWGMAAHLGGLFLALLAKEAALAIPVLCAGWVCVAGRFGVEREASEPSSLAARIPRLPWAGWGGILLFWFLIRLSALGLPGLTGFSHSGIRSVFAIPGLLLRFYGKAIIPADLRLVPTFSDSSPFWGMGALILTALALLEPGRRDHRLLLLFGLGWFIVWLVPSLPFGDPGDREELGLLEHRLYLPLMGVVLFCTLLMVSRKHSLSSGFLRGWGQAAMVVLVAALAFRTWVRLPDLKGPEEFWRAVERQSPRCGMAGIGLSEFFLQTGRLEEAREVLERTRESHPSQQNLHLNLGRYYRARGELEAAEKMFQREIALFPGSLRAYRHLASLYREWGKPDEARLWEWRGEQIVNDLERQVRQPWNSAMPGP